MVKFDLDTIIESIADSLETTYKKVESFKYSKEYILPNVEEPKLLELGFQYKGLTTSTKLPLYEYENLIAVFDYQLLHICQVGD